MRKLFRSFVAISGLVVLAWGPGAASAQGQVEITAPPPARVPRPEFVIPGLPPSDVTGPRGQDDFYADEIRVRLDPAFIVPLSATVSTGPKTVARFGFSGWTAPRGRGDLLVAREISGWFGLGFSFVWDIPVPSETPGTPPIRPTPR